MKKQFLALVLTVLLLLPLMGMAETEKSSYNPLDYGMEAFAEPVTLKIPVFDRARDDVPDVASNHYTQWINKNFGENLNVKVEFIPINRADTMGAYNLLLVSEEWPTLFAEYDWPKVSQWYGDGALATFDIEEFRNVAPVWFEKAGGQAQFDMFMLDGNYVFAPTLRPNWNTDVNFVTWYRKDWYRNAGIELFTNYEEYVKAMKLFMDLGYTNGKPILPKAPFSANFQVYGDSEWPRLEEEWVMYADIAVAPLPSRGGYYALKKQNNEYNLGLYSTEFELDAAGGTSASQATADFINGEAYSYGAYLNAAEPDLLAFYQNNPDAELGVIYNTNVPNVWADAWGATTVPQTGATNPAGYYIGFSSKATADEIKAAWMYLEWLSQPVVLDYMQWGVEGQTYTVDADGNRVRKPWNEQGEYWMGYASNKDYWALTEESHNIPVEESIKARMPKNLPQDFTQELLDQYSLNVANVSAGLTYVNPFFTVNINSVNEYQGSLEALFKEYATALVKCKPEEFDTLYKQYSQAYLDAGYQEIIDERLAAYKAGNSTKLPDIAAGRAPYVAPDYLKVLEGRTYTIGK